MTATHYSLVGDIGGTNARFALVEKGGVQPGAIEILPCGEYTNLDDACGNTWPGSEFQRWMEPVWPLPHRFEAPRFA